MLTWYITGAVAALAVAWVAAMLHVSGHAPLGLVSLGVGAALGTAVIAIAKALRVAGQRKLILSTALFAIITVLSQHAWLYLDFRRQWHEARAASPEVALFRPESPWWPGEYLARELTLARAALWGLDAALVVAAAVAVVIWWQRRSK